MAINPKQVKMQSPDPDTVCELIKHAAESFILPRYKNLQKDEILTKTGPADFVTAADEEAEEFLKERLMKLVHGSIVVGEEGVAKNPDLIKVLRDPKQPIWIVDPVDGTGNFVSGEGPFGSMVALVQGGETVMSWVYHIPDDEMVFSEKGSGAYLNGKSLSLRSVQEEFLRKSGFLGSKYFPENQQEAVRDQCALFDNTESAGCAAYEYLQIAKGEMNFAVYWGLKPWDHAPGALMVEEAGGLVRLWNGAAFKPLPDADQHGIIVADSENTWRETYNKLLQKPLNLPTLSCS